MQAYCIFAADCDKSKEGFSEIQTHNHEVKFEFIHHLPSFATSPVCVVFIWAQCYKYFHRQFYVIFKCFFF